MNYFAGVDIGGTKIEVLIVDKNNQVHGNAYARTNSSNPAKLTDDVVHAVEQALVKANLNISQLTAVGVGIPGQVDPHSGLVKHAVNLNIENYDLGHALSVRLNCPVKLENDLHLAALGAYTFLNPENVQNLCYLNIGTGVAAGLILNGKLYRGENGMAGEVGHMVITNNKRVCQCGNIGCLETLVAGPGIAASAEMILTQTPNSLLHDISPPIKAADVYKLAALQDVAAIKIVAEAGQILGHVLQNLVMAYDVGKLILGGGVTKSGSIFLQPILQEWERQKAISPLAKTILKPDLVALAPPDFQAGLWGALLIVNTETAETTQEFEIKQ